MPRPIRFIRTHRFAGAAAVLALATVPALATANPVDALLGRYAARHKGISALVQRLDAAVPAQVAAINARESLAPASTMKIITSAAALLTMGPTFRFTTCVESARDAVVSPDGTLAGPAYLIGAGDPMLATRAFSRNFLDNTGTQIERLAVNIRQSGIRTISGGIVVDESLFDARRTGPQWEGSYVWECGPLSAAATNQGRAGNSEGRNVSSPPLAAGQRLAAALRRAGVKVHGAIRSGPDVPGGTVVGQVRSRPISAILGFMNPASNNFSAEMLTKDVGAYGSGHGTTAAGTARATAILRDQGAFVPGDHLVDGSGLSHANRLSAWTLVTTLAQANANPRWGDALVQSLEHGGEGTLRRRLRDPAVGPRVRAKTGYISGVASLAGIVTSPAGATYAFAFLINDPNISLAQRTMDRAVTLLATGAADGAQAINR